MNIFHINNFVQLFVGAQKRKIKAHDVIMLEQYIWIYIELVIEYRQSWIYQC